MSIFWLTFEETQFSAEVLAQFKAQIPAGLELIMTSDREQVCNRLDEIEVAVGWVPPSLMGQMPNLKWLHFWGGGTDWLIKYPELRTRPFVLTNSVGVAAVPISEHIFALLLTLGRNLRNADRAQRAGAWARMRHPTEDWQSEPFDFSWQHVFELAGKTLLLIGMGAIGERTAKLAQAFDMRVIGVRNRPEKASPYVNLMVGPDQLLEALPAADFVVMAAPLTDATYHLLDAAAFAAMRSHAWLINIGRGRTIDEPALIAALQNGEIAGAALDVFEKEPLAAESPLWNMENVLITSHYAGGTPTYHERAMALLLDNLQRFAADKPLKNVVDKMAGY